MPACGDGLRRAVFAIVAAGGWFALVSQFVMWLSALGWLATALLFFSYFSIVSNILVAGVATAVAARSRVGPARTRFSAAVAVYITIVAVIWQLLLRGSYTLSGLALVADTLMHEVLPPAYVAAWLITMPKGALRFRDAAAWLVLPLCYAAWMFGRGAVDGWYPYPFLDVRAIGYPKAIAGTAVFVLLFWIVGLVYVAVDRLRSARSGARSHRASAFPSTDEP